MMLLLTFVCGLAAVRASEEVETTTPGPQNITCTGHYASVTSTHELLENLVARVFDQTDNETRVILKRKFLEYLSRSPVFLDTIGCNSTGRVPRQDDEDGDDDGGGGGGGGGAAGAAGANPLDNSNVLNGVRRILANVFTGNLVGVLQESVSLRGPEPVATVFTDVLSTLFGSTATAGITGIIGNITTTARPLNASSTLPPGYEAYIQQHYLQQQYLQQQAALQQQQQLGGGGFQNQLGSIQQQQQLGVGGVQNQLGGISRLPQQQGLGQGIGGLQQQQQQFVPNAYPQQVRNPVVGGVPSAGLGIGQAQPQQPSASAVIGDAYKNFVGSVILGPQAQAQNQRPRATKAPVVNEEEYDDDD